VRLGRGCRGAGTVTGDGALDTSGLKSDELVNWHTSKYSFGPILDGLFTQSNYGIVTRMGIWLLPRPPAVRSFHFAFPEDDARYLIPELLVKQQPAAANDFKPEACLNFEYHYSVLPEGLLPRFIVRTNVLSEGLERWRSGTIMEFEGCRALVKADAQERRVSISVAGPPANRRRLLAVIRSDFERIHRDIHNLQPSEMVPVPDYPKVVVAYEKLLAMERARLFWRRAGHAGDRVNAIARSLAKRVMKGRSGAAS